MAALEALQEELRWAADLLWCHYRSAQTADPLKARCNIAI